MERKTNVQCGRFITINNNNNNNNKSNNNNDGGGYDDDDDIACKILGLVTGPTNSPEIF